MPAAVQNLPLRPLLATGEVVTQIGEARGLFKAAQWASKALGNKEFGEFCGNADKGTKVLANIENVGKVFQPGLPPLQRVKAVAGVYTLGETVFSIGLKFNFWKGACAVTPLAWITLGVDVSMAAIEAGESTALVCNKECWAETDHLDTKRKEAEKTLGACPSNENEAKVNKWKNRKISFDLNIAKTVLNIAFQISLIVMFIFLAAPLIGGTIGLAALVAGGVVSLLGVSKLALKIAALSVTNRLPEAQRVRKRTTHALDANGERTIPKAKKPDFRNFDPKMVVKV